MRKLFRNTCAIGFAGVIISLEQLEYTTTEGERVVICADVVAGVSNKVLILNVSTINGMAEGLLVLIFCAILV